MSRNHRALLVYGLPGEEVPDFERAFPLNASGDERVGVNPLHGVVVHTRSLYEDLSEPENFLVGWRVPIHEVIGLDVREWCADFTDHYGCRPRILAFVEET